jgi:hypothetical protein
MKTMKSALAVVIVAMPLLLAGSSPANLGQLSLPHSNSVIGDQIMRHVSPTEREDGLPIQGISGVIFAVTVFNDQLIVGGYFDVAGGAIAQNAAAWNGTSWLPLGSGVNGDVEALTIYGGQLIAGGNFTGVYALTVYDGDLIAGGEFETASGDSI